MNAVRFLVVVVYTIVLLILAGWGYLYLSVISIGVVILAIIGFSDEINQLEEKESL